MPRIQVRKRYVQISEFERRRVVRLKETGWSYRLIARHLSRSGAAIRRGSKEWVNDGRTQRQEGSSRLRETTECEDRFRAELTIPDASLSLIVRATSASVTAKTIQRRLKERGLKSRHPLRPLPLTSVQRQAGVRWCQPHSLSNVTD